MNKKKQISIISGIEDYVHSFEIFCCDRWCRVHWNIIFSADSQFRQQIFKGKQVNINWGGFCFNIYQATYFLYFLVMQTPQNQLCSLDKSRCFHYKHLIFGLNTTRQPFSFYRSIVFSACCVECVVSRNTARIHGTHIRTSCLYTYWVSILP